MIEVSFLLASSYWLLFSSTALQLLQNCECYIRSSDFLSLHSFILVMARQFPAKATRTGKPLSAPSESDLYSKNAAPGVRLLPRDWDFVDADGQRYWDARAHDSLTEWIKTSIICDLIADQYNSATDTVFFVRQSAEQKQDNAVFTMQEDGLLTLYARNTLAVHTCSILEVGDRASTSYKARSVRWLLARGLAPVSIASAFD